MALNHLSTAIPTSDAVEDFAPYRLNRDPSPLNRTEFALLSRGVDSAVAARLRKSGWTLGRLKQQQDAQLEALGLTSDAIRAIRAGGRPDIPFENLIQVLVANRFTCCVCHDPKKAIIVHHIREWSKSHDHSPSNLAVLCLDHHDKAHSVSKLTRNLNEPTLLRFKDEWENEVRRTNTEAVLEASRLNSDAWWYFNHVRLFEVAAHLKIRLKDFLHYHHARAAGLIHPDGSLRPRSNQLSYMYSGGEGMVLYEYVREATNAVLEQLTILNISDYLDRGVLAPVLNPGDIVFVQGAHTFTALSDHRSGRDQTCRGTRKANRVEVSFTFDRWEATSNSAFSCWLSGRQEAGSVVRIAKAQNVNGTLRIEGTALGICMALQGLKQREYSAFPYRRGVIVFDDADDDDSEADDDPLDVDASWEGPADFYEEDAVS